MNGITIAPGIDLSKIRHVLFDLDGTLYRGKRLFPWTAEALALLEKRKIGFTYLTNNSSRSAADYLEKIRRLNLPGGAEHIWTSSLATLEWIRTNCPDAKRIYLLGTESLAREFRDHGFTLISEHETLRPDLLVVAFDTELVYARLCKAAWWAKERVPFIATHPDKICPTDQETVLIDCGAVLDCIESATGRAPDAVCGKPNENMITGILAKYRLKPEETAMVGDRIYTDMEMAKRAGVVGVLVLSGEATRDDWEKSGPACSVIADNALAFVRALAPDQKNRFWDNER